MNETKQTLLTLGVTLISGLSLLAATSTWTGGGSDAYWTNAANWAAGVPATGDDIAFPDVANQIVDLSDALPTIGALNFNAADDYTLQTGTLTLGGSVTQSGAGAVAFAADLTLDLGGADRTFTGAGSGLMRFDSPIGGTGGINIAGGTYALAQPSQTANTFSGNVNVTGGTLQVIASGFGNLFYQPGFDPLSSGVVTNDGGRIELISEDSLGTIVMKRTSYFGPNGGTLVYGNFNNQIPNNNLNANVVNGPATFVVYPARLSTTDPTGSSANDNQAGAFQLQNLAGTGPITVVLRNGAAGRFQVQPVNDPLNPTFTGPIIIDGQPGGDCTADQDPASPNGGTNIVHWSLNNISNPYHVPLGIYFKNACQLWFTHSNQRQLASDVVIMTNAAVAVQGRPSAGSARTFDFGTSGGPYKVTIQDGGLLQTDLHISRWVTPGSSVNHYSKVIINAGGTLRFARTYDPGGANVNNIAVHNTITGEGVAAKDAVMDLQLDNGTGTQNGVTFNAGANLIVNGAGAGGLRVQAKSAAALGNLLTSARLNGITGSGGALTLALANNDTFTIAAGPSSSSAVALALDNQGGSAPTYVLGTDATLANFAGLILKAGTVAVNDASTAAAPPVTLAASTTLQLGTPGGSGAVVNFANSSAATWTGTLTIANWDGSQTGGGADQVFFGNDATGLTPAQLAQITWLNPFGGGDVVGATILATGEIVPLAPPVTTINDPAIVGGELQFNVSAASPAQTSIIQRATNLTAPVYWENIATNTGSFSFTESGTASRPEAYYRVLVQ